MRHPLVATRRDAVGDGVDGDRNLPAEFSAGAVDFMKFFGVAGTVSLFLSGFTYASVYYQKFGLLLVELGIGYLETIEFVVYLFSDHWVPTFGAICIAIVSFLVMIAVRYRLGNMGVYIAVTPLFLIVPASQCTMAARKLSQTVRRS